MAALAHATTAVPPRDLGELAAGSNAVVTAVAGLSEVERRGGRPVTITDMTAREVVSGSLAPGASFQVEVPGGVTAGLRWEVDGAPHFAPGATYLLSLVAGDDGTWRPRMLAYGVLEETAGKGGGKLLQPVAESGRIVALSRPDHEPVEAIATYREGELVAHLGRVLRGEARWNGALVRASAEEIPLSAGAAQSPSGCAFIGQSGGRPERWKGFDSGATVTIYANGNEEPSLGLDGGAPQLEGAIADWMAAPGTTLKLRYGGRKSYTMRCSSGQDSPGAGDNVVVFGDPCNDITNLSSCWGILAFGGPWSAGNHRFDGATWDTITSLFVVVNGGVGCIGADNARRMLTHELGHGLGFAHVDDSNALMYRYCCNGIGPLDAACVQYLYPAGGAVAPAAPGSLAASDGTFADFIRLSWSPVVGAASFTIWRNTVASNASATQIGSTPSATFDDGSAVAGSHYTYWVVASNPFGSSRFSNPDAGFRPCPAPPPPSLAAPAAADAGASYTLAWTRGGAAEEYQIDEAEEPSFAGARRVPATEPSASFSHEVSGSKTYYYRVSAATPCAGAPAVSPFSNVAQVVVNAPEAPTVDPLYLPAAAHAPGAQGTQWRTDVALYNPSEHELSYTIELLRDRSSGAPESRTFTLGAGQSISHHDIVSTVFGAIGVAALRISSTDPLRASGRTYNQTSQGTFGQLIQAKRLSGAARAGEVARLFPLASSATRERGFRTNLGLVNASAVPITIEVNLFRGDGRLVTTLSYSLAPASFTQATDVYGQVKAGDVQAGFAEVRTTTPEGAFFAYASVVDNLSGDPLYIATR